MRSLRTIHAVAVLITTFGAGLAAGGRPRAAIVLIVLSIVLLAWSLERIRDELVRRETKP